MIFAYNINILPFILWNVLTIFIVGVVYFVTKEIYRIKGGNVGNLGITTIGIFLGIGLLMLFLLLNMEVTAGYLAQSTVSEDQFFPNNIYNQVILSPTIILIIIFVVMIDNRLVFPLFIFQMIGLVLMMRGINITSDNQYVFWARLLFTGIDYLLLVVILFFMPSIRIIKNNGIKLLISIVVYIFISSLLSILYFISISGQVDTASWFDSNIATSLIGINYGYVALYGIFQGTIILLIEKFYSNFNALETFSIQDDVSYYKMSLAQNRLVKMIDDEKINFGLLALFQIKTNDGNKATRILERLRIHTEDKYKNTFYFKASANYYGAFFQLSDNYKLETSLKNNKSEVRTEDDELFEITRQIVKISSAEKVQISTAGSIYGIHSYSIAELIEHCRFLMSPIVTRANSNPLIIYDYKRVKERLNETTRVRNLPVDIENIRISLLRGLSSEEVFYPSITFKEDDNTLTNIIKKGELRPEQTNILLRHSSYQTLRKFNKQKGSLIIYYSSNHLNSKDFKFKDFIKKTDRYIEHDKLIIGIITNKETMGDKFVKNVAKLREEGIRFALINPTSATQEEHDILNPEFILDPSTKSNPLKIKKVKLGFKTNAILLNPNLVN